MSRDARISARGGARPHDADAAAHAHALRTPPLHHVEMAPVTGIPVGESFGGQSQAAAVIAAAREAENFSRNLRAVAERETRAFSVSIDGAVRQAQKRVDERVDAAIAARVDPAIMSALEKAPKTTALVDELTLKLEARITEQAAPIVARLAREEVVRHQLASAIEQRVARTAQQRTIEVLVGVAGGLLAGGAIASHFNNPRGSR